jgi:hypothetical protein
MIVVAPPEPLDDLLDTLASFLDARHAELLAPLFLGTVLAWGRRTATAWFRACGIGAEFRRGYTLLGSLGRRVPLLASVVFGHLRRSIDPGPRWLFALDDTPTRRYGPHVEGAGTHRNPTPGPAHQRYLYGHVWVTLAWAVRHPGWDTLALPLWADLYIREKDLPAIDAGRRPEFRTKLDMAAEQIAWAARAVHGSGKPVWVAVDGGYSNQPVLRAARKEGVVVVGRLRKDAALYGLPPAPPGGRRRPGRPPVYGKDRLSLARRGAHPLGWQEVQCHQYQKDVTKQVKTFLATWHPAGGVIRVVVVREDDGWLAYFCTDPGASAKDILEAAADRTALEQVNKDVKEVEGAGQQQLRYWRANAGAFNLCLWSHAAVEWWAWGEPDEDLADRSASPWDTADRRPSHQDKRKALQRECLWQEFQSRLRGRPCPPEILGMVQVLLWRGG